MLSEQDGARRPRVSVIKARARGEELRVVQVQGNLFVCSRANGNCCCGWGEKGRFVFDNALWADEWERRMIRNRLHLTFTGCLGPCVVGNNALLQLHGRSIWLKDLNGPEYPGLVFGYAQAMLDAVLPPPLPGRPRGVRPGLAVVGGWRRAGALGWDAVAPLLAAWVALHAVVPGHAEPWPAEAAPHAAAVECGEPEAARCPAPHAAPRVFRN